MVDERDDYMASPRRASTVQTSSARPCACCFSCCRRGQFKVTPVGGITISIPRQHCCKNKKLGCRRETARRFVSLNILLSHSRSLKVIRNDTVTLSVCQCVSISMTLCLCAVPFLRYSASKNGMNLKLGVWVIQGHYKWRHSIDRMRLSIGRPL